ncbi:MAG: hypothetical protein BV456_03560 [Thermoplasmata archaeon M8B2D]|nr:MAG: hypothetical protein BV456_03560 [Thermoplasmata archaeon M8B2D]
MKGKIKKIANHYGFEHQLLKMKEEIEELKTEIDDYIYNYSILHNDEISAKHLIEEMADSYIMILQNIYLFEAKEDFKNMIEFKLNRQLERIKKHDMEEVLCNVKNVEVKM